MMPIKLTRRNWTVEEEIELKQLVAEGFTQQQIAFRMSRTKSSVYSKIHKLQIQHPKQHKWTDAEYESLIELWKSRECTRAQMANYLGMSVQQVRGKIANSSLTEIDEAYRGGQSFVPWIIKSNSILLAKTCPSCGEFLDACEFWRPKKNYKNSEKLWASKCRKCHSKQRSDVYKQKTQFRNNKYYEKLQNISIKTADRKGQPLTSFDIGLISDHSKPDIQVAIETGRTYASISNNRARLQLDQKHIARLNAKQIVWLIKFSEKNIIDRKFFARLGPVPESEWDWND